MKTGIIGIVLGLGLAWSAGAQAIDNFVFGFSPRTGDAFVDAQLGDINVFAAGNTDGFIDEVVVGFGAPRYLVREYYYDRRWAPGDIYYACAIAYHLGRPCLDILRIYERDHAQGWGVIAQRLGIKPGSPAFHALKGHVGKGHGRMQGNAGRGGPPAASGKGGKPAGGPPPGKGQEKGGKGKGNGRG
ncbi:hypothetical protein [Arenimonas fontis]|uniref:Lytic transglycosylase domain-containing protein n=1 Tax=Arenimonas fontis TaxID=2608255 RepID=A0A5B2Z9T1_9GAMM|nr:hypothetical protein [Arenimonas fontis]KAA2283971.1 hypothetical protein F0415_11745 [Arenimonas fontis]